MKLSTEETLCMLAVEERDTWMREIKIPQAPVGDIKITRTGERPIRLEPAPPQFAELLTDCGVLDAVTAEGKAVICDFLWLVFKEQFEAKMLDIERSGAANLRPALHPPSPALREKLKSSIKRVGKLVEMGVSENLPKVDLLRQAHTDLQEFSDRQFKWIKIRYLTGTVWLRERWWARAPAVSYALSALLETYANRCLNQREILERIARVHAKVLKLNVETDAIRKQIRRFKQYGKFGAQRAILWRTRYLLNAIKKIPHYYRRTPPSAAPGT
jgi:hypothetical protein